MVCRVEGVKGGGRGARGVGWGRGVELFFCLHHQLNHPNLFSFLPYLDCVCAARPARIAWPQHSYRSPTQCAPYLDHKYPGVVIFYCTAAGSQKNYSPVLNITERLSTRRQGDI